MKVLTKKKAAKRNPATARIDWDMVRARKRAEKERLDQPRRYGTFDGDSVVDLAKWTHSTRAKRAGVRTAKDRLDVINRESRLGELQATPAGCRKAKEIARKDSFEEEKRPPQTSYYGNLKGFIEADRVKIEGRIAKEWSDQEKKSLRKNFEIRKRLLLAAKKELDRVGDRGIKTNDLIKKVRAESGAESDAIAKTMIKWLGGLGFARYSDRKWRAVEPNPSTKKKAAKRKGLITQDEFDMAEAYSRMKEFGGTLGEHMDVVQAERIAKKKVSKKKTVSDREFWKQIELLDWPNLRKKLIAKGLSWDDQRARLLKEKPLSYWDEIYAIASAKGQALIDRLDLGSNDFALDFSADIVGHGKKMYDRMMSDAPWARKQLASEKYGVENFSYILPSKGWVYGASDISKAELAEAYERLKKKTAKLKVTKKKTAKKKAAKKVSKKTPEWQLLCNRCAKLWDHYCERPSKTRLKPVLEHLEKMKASTSKKVADERKRCLRVANKEARRLKMK